jgi:hypothetical protein
MHPGLIVLQELGQLRAALPRPPEPGPPRPAASSHRFAAHTPVWRYMDPRLAELAPGPGPGLDLLPHCGPGTTQEDALARSRCILALGASPTPQLLALVGRGDQLVFLFEPDPSRAAALVESVGVKSLAGRPVFLFVGEVEALHPEFESTFTRQVFEHGAPLALVETENESLLLSGLASTVEYVEMLYYRRVLYPLQGHDLARSLPLREMGRGPYFDQQKHMYENVPLYVGNRTAGALQGLFPGGTAVVAAAGPELEHNIDYLRRRSEDCVLIAVNNALKPLVRHGLEPHICMVVDNASVIRRSFRGLPGLPETTLVAHSLCHVNREVFSRVLFFGDCLPEVFPPPPELEWHGSVLTAAFSLARWMGCAECVLVGAQLASENPWRLDYAPGSVHDAEPSVLDDRPRTDAWPQLYPVRGPGGRQLFTTLNFRDVAIWLRLAAHQALEQDRMRTVNTSRASQLHGPPFDQAEDPRPARPVSAARALAALDPWLAGADPVPAVAFLEAEQGKWRHLLEWVAAAFDPTRLTPHALELLQECEAHGVSHMVQRFGGFDNARFHALFFDAPEGPEGDASRLEALDYYFGHVTAMARRLVDILEHSAAELTGG